MLQIWGPPSPLSSLRERISRSASPPLFPIDMRDVPAGMTFHDVPLEQWAIGGATLAGDLGRASRADDRLPDRDTGRERRVSAGPRARIGRLSR